MRKTISKYSTFSLRVQTIKPEGQVELNEEELMEEHSNILETKLKQEIELVEYSWKKAAWIPTYFNHNYIKLVQLQGTILHQDSADAQILMQGGYLKGSEMTLTGAYTESGGDLEVKEEAAVEEEEGVEAQEEESEIEEEQGKVFVEEQEEEIEEEEIIEEAEQEVVTVLEEHFEGEEEETDESEESGEMKFVKLPNAFNFVENETLTYNIYYEDFEMQTEKDCRIIFCEGFSQMLLYDMYAQDVAIEEEKKKLIERERQKYLHGKGPQRKEKSEEENPLKKKLYAAEIIEKMLISNIYADLYMDYQYWNDPSDEFKEKEGTLLPLFTFQIEQFSNHAVTFIDTSMNFKEVFAVGYGCFEHARHELCPGGGFAIFTVGNPDYPMWTVTTDVGVMAVAIHKDYPNLIACGLWDGEVQVYDYNRYFEKDPAANCEDKQMHLGIVTQVVWGNYNEYRNVNLYSCGMDGCVVNWSITGHGLEKMLILKQKMFAVPRPGPFGIKIPLMCSFTCICFHPENHQEYLIGDEFGSIYKCHLEYMYSCLLEYKAHDLVVTRIDYNKFLTTIFASSSNDYMVKIWEEGRLKSLFDLDLDCAVGDVQWAPYSATVLAACTDNGYVHIFDIDINSHKAICIQRIVPKRKCIKLTRVEFNTELPILRIGDDRGTVHLVRISPNLRQKVIRGKKDPEMTNEELELRKLNNLLYFVREPDVFEIPKDMYIDSSTGQLNFVWE